VLDLVGERVALLADFVCPHVVDAERGEQVPACVDADLRQRRARLDHS
jgi:hypothetical protein